MRYSAGFFLSLLLFCGLGSGQSQLEVTRKHMMVKRITPVLYVKEIEPCIPFWVDRLGFKKTAEVPDGDRLGFVMLEKGGLEIMYQTFSSAEKSPAA